MTATRRLTLAAIAAAAWLAAAPAQADTWPSRPIRFVVPFAAGGANDLLGRAAAEGASKVLGQAIIVENRPGAGATIGADAVAKSAPDGYTFLISAAGIVSNSMIKHAMPYKDSDLVPVVMIGVAPSVIVVPASSTYKDLKSLVAGSHNGAGLHFATAGTGSTPHFVAEQLHTRYGAKLDIIPYKSGAASINAALGGEIDATSEASIVVLGHLKSGKLRGLATTWTHRIAAYPDLPTAIEQGFPEVQIAHWAGVHAPRGTPPEILDRVAAAVDTAMKAPATVERLRAMGIEPVGGTRASFTDFVEKERARLGAIVKASGMKED